MASLNPYHLVYLHQSPSHPLQLYLWLRRCSGQCLTPEHAWSEQYDHWLLWTHGHLPAGPVEWNKEWKMRDYFYWLYLNYHIHIFIIESDFYLSILVPLQSWGRKGLGGALQGQCAVDLDFNLFGGQSFAWDIIFIDLRGDWRYDTSFRLHWLLCFLIIFLQKNFRIMLWCLQN